MKHRLSTAELGTGKDEQCRALAKQSKAWYGEVWASHCIATFSKGYVKFGVWSYGFGMDL